MAKKIEPAAAPPPAEPGAIPGAVTRAVRCRPGGPHAFGFRVVGGITIPADVPVELPAAEADALVAEYPGLELVG